MSKNQEDNATSTNEETTEAQRKKHEEFLARLEKSRAELEEKSVEEIKKLSILELAKYFYDDYLLIRNYQEYKKISPDNPSEEQKHDSDSHLEKHSKPDIDKLITVFDTLKTRLLQLSQYDQNSSSIFNTHWTTIMMEHINKLQDLTPEYLKNITKEMQENFQSIIVGLKQLLDTPSLQEPSKTWETIIKSKDTVANLTEEDKATIAASEKELELEIALLQISYKIDYLKKEEKVLEQQLHGEDVPTTGSSNLGGDDLA